MSNTIPYPQQSHAVHGSLLAADLGQIYLLQNTLKWGGGHCGSIVLRCRASLLYLFRLEASTFIVLGDGGPFRFIINIHKIMGALYKR